MTTEDLLKNEVTHRYAGNGYAVVEMPTTTISSLTGKPTDYVRVTDKWCQSKQAFLVAMDHLELTMRGDPPQPVALIEDELKNLTPLREGIASGKLKVISTRFIKQNI